MCGIAGYISDKKPTKKIIKSMTDRIAHRGPDGEGFYLDDNIALGHRRLAIIDLETGDQPIYNEDKDIVVINKQLCATGKSVIRFNRDCARLINGDFKKRRQAQI